MFSIDTEAVSEIPTQPARWSKKRKMPVSFNALEFLTSIDQVTSSDQVNVEVEVADTGFTEAEFAQHQQDQIGEQDQSWHLSMGGVVHTDSQWPVSASLDTALTGATSNAPSSLGYQTQFTNRIPDETSKGVAEIQYGTSTYFTEDTAFPQEILQQGQHAYPDPNVDVYLSALDDWYTSEWLPHNPLSLPQAPNAHQDKDLNTSNNFGNFDSDYPDSQQYMQHQQTLPHMSNAHVYSNPSSDNRPVLFDDRNSNFMPQYSHTLQQQRHNANTNTNDDLGTIEARIPGSFPTYADSVAICYEYTNLTPHDFHAP